MRCLSWSVSSESPLIKSVSLRKSLKLRTKLWLLIILNWLCFRRKMTSPSSSLRERKTTLIRWRKLTTSLLSQTRSWLRPLRTPILSTRQRRKNTRRQLTKETSSVLSLSVETMSLPCFTRKSRFFKPLLQREKFSTQKDLKTSESWVSSLLIWSASSELSKLKLLRFKILRMRFTTCRTNSSPSVSKLRLYQKSWRTPWTTIVGEDLKELIPTHGKCFKRFKLCRNV